MSNPKRTHFAIMEKRAKALGLTLNDYKLRPQLLFAKDKDFASYVMNKFNYNDEITWFGRKVKWSDLLAPNNMHGLSVNVDDDFNSWVQDKHRITLGNTNVNS